jgi:hypothetical protein
MEAIRWRMLRRRTGKGHKEMWELLQRRKTHKAV